MKCLIFSILLFGSILSAQEEPIGFWKTINDKTGKAESIIAIYPYQNQYFGRIIATINPKGEIIDTMEHPKTRAPGVEGDGFYSGMDIIWGLQKNQGTKYVGGKILDPEKGRIYDAEMWLKNGNLNVRGQIWIFGQTQVWVPAQDNDFPPNFEKPDLSVFVPTIPKPKH